MDDQQTMEEMLLDDVVSKWGNEQLPNEIQLGKLAWEVFGIGITDGIRVAKDMLNNNKSELAEMGYDINDSPPSPPVYQEQT
tara:strand:- start:626 stop:871 length:246 start_codon:yes stop_codon:yes gene_type:complete